MAIALEFIDVVVPIARIREAYPGGWEQCALDYAALLGRRVWHDGHLFRDGAMSALEVQTLVEGWAVLGFEATGTRRGELYSKDLCVVNWRRGGPTRPCDWLCFDRPSRSAHLAGTEPGLLAWRGQPEPLQAEPSRGADPGDQPGAGLLSDAGAGVSAGAAFSAGAGLSAGSISPCGTTST